MSRTRATDAHAARTPDGLPRELTIITVSLERALVERQALVLQVAAEADAADAANLPATPTRDSALRASTAYLEELLGRLAVLAPPAAT
jgi:hypothetical protein